MPVLYVGVKIVPIKYFAPVNRNPLLISFPVLVVDAWARVDSAVAAISNQLLRMQKELKSK